MGMRQSEVSEMCNKCMQNAPFDYCCKLECGEHYFCENCNSSAKQIVFECPELKKENENAYNT